MSNQDSRYRERGPRKGDILPIEVKSPHGLYDIRDALASLIRDKVDPGSTLTVEYPGFISLTLIDGSSWNIGTANGTWAADLSDHAGRNIGAFDTYLVPTAPAEVVARAIVAVLEEYR